MKKFRFSLGRLICLVLLAGSVATLIFFITRPLSGKWKPNLLANDGIYEMKLMDVQVQPWANAPDDIKNLVNDNELKSYKKGDYYLAIIFKMSPPLSFGSGKGFLESLGPINVKYGDEELERLADTGVYQMDDHTVCFLHQKIRPVAIGLPQKKFDLEYSIKIDGGEMLQFDFSFTPGI